MLSRNLEESLHRAIALASERRHEYATLEHLLFALTEDRDAIAVIRACGVDIEKLQKELGEYLGGELEMMVASLAEDPKLRITEPSAASSSGASRPTGA